MHLLIHLPSPGNMKKVLTRKCISAVQFIGTSVVMALEWPEYKLN